MTTSCKTCKYADFPRTLTGRIQRNMPGKCTYDATLIKVPICFKCLPFRSAI